jgi:hypothetical protein
MKLFFRAAAVLGAVVSVVPSAAQEPAAEELSLRVLPLGNRAPFTQVVRDGVRHETDPPEGSLPPRELSVGLEPREGAEERGEKVMRLRLGEISPELRLPPADPPAVVMRDVEKDRVWLKRGLAGSNATLLVVWRTGKTWDEVRSIALDDSAAAIPAGSARVVNAAPAEVGVVWGKQRFRLPAGRSMLLRYPEGSRAVPLQILHAGKDGKLRPCLSTTAEADPSKRRQWFVFRSDRADARSPFQVLPVAEPR